MTVRDRASNSLKALLGNMSRLLGHSPVGQIRVRVRAGLSEGANWTLLPFSSYWRRGGAEGDVLAATTYFPSLEGLVFWDFGAHFGIHTVGMARHVGAGGAVVSFEPDPVAFGRLKRHVELNKLTNVKIYQAAVSRENGNRQMFFPNGKGAAVSHFRFYETDDMRGVPSAEVQTISPDRLVALGAIRLPNIIKVDVQGHGAESIAGAFNAIQQSLPIIAFSNHSDAERDGTRALLEPLSYQPTRFDGSPCSWEDLTEVLLVPASFARPGAVTT